MEMFDEMAAMPFYDLRPDAVLFGEEGESFLVATSMERWDDLETALVGFSYDEIGTTGGSRLKIPGLIDVSLDELRGAYERDLFESHAPQGGHIG